MGLIDNLYIAAPIVYDSSTMTPIAELRFQDLPIYDCSVVVMTHERINNPIEPEVMYNNTYKFMYLVPISHHGYGTLSYHAEDIGKEVMVKIRARDYCPYAVTTTLAPNIMIIPNPLRPDRGYEAVDPEVEALEGTPDRKTGEWMPNLIEEILTELA